MNKLFKINVILTILAISISCNSSVTNPSSYVDLMKNQKLTYFSLDATIGEVFDVVSKGKAVWEAGPMPANDSEYRYRNIHKTSILVEAFWPINLGVLYGNNEVELKIQFAVKKDKSEFELYRTAINGEYENSAETIKTAQSIGVDYINMLNAIAKEKQKEELARWAAETAPYIDAIKKIHSDIYDDTLENTYNTIANSFRDGKVEWSCQKLDSGKDGIRLYLVLATFPVDERLWGGWGQTAHPIIMFGHIAGKDLLKMGNNKWKQGDVYAIYRKCELTDIEKIDINKEEDIKIYKELQDYMFSLYEHKTGKDIMPSQLEIERNEVAPYIEAVKKTYSKTYDDTYDNFYTIYAEDHGSIEWTAYKLEVNDPQIDKDLLNIIGTTENNNNRFYIVELQLWMKHSKTSILFFAGDEWAKATNNKMVNGDIYKVKEEDTDLSMNKPEDVKKWIAKFNEMLSLYWFNKSSMRTEKSYQKVTELKDAR